VNPTPDFVFDGWSNVVSLGDLDRDGYDDLLVLYGNPDPILTEGRDAARHVLYRGSASGPVKAEELGTVLDPPGQLRRLGDINGDGFADAIVQDGSTFYVYLGSASGFRPISDGMGTHAGPIAGAGDVNKDALDDIVVGSPADERVDVYRGATDWTFVVAADVAVEKGTSLPDSFPGSSGFVVTVTNHGPDPARVRLVDLFPSAIAGAQWICFWQNADRASARCLGDVVETGDIDSLITIASGGSMTIDVPTNVPFLPVVNTASLVLPGFVVDPDLSNNRSTAVNGPPEQALFADGFESGDLSA
jgi:hypothetical protein